MSADKTQSDKERMDRIVAEARRHREQGYREQALKIFTWICARCGRDFFSLRRRYRGASFAFGGGSASASPRLTALLRMAIIWPVFKSCTALATGNCVPAPGTLERGRRDP